jgi:hypothetical protein
MKKGKPTNGAQGLAYALLVFAAFGCVCSGGGNQSGGNKPQQQGMTAQCTTKLAEAPELRGFQLGMTLDEIRKRFPNLKMSKPDEFGYAHASIYNAEAREFLGNPLGTYVNSSNHPEFKDMFVAHLEFISGRLAAVRTGYPQGGVNMEVADYQKRVAESLKLPADAYERDPAILTTPTKGTITCDGFRVEVGKDGWRHRDKLLPTLYFMVRMEDTAALDTLARKEAGKKEAERYEEEKRAREFKP